MGTLVCRHCGKEVQSNKKLKHLIQKYCGRKTCQAERKLNFERRKYRTNSLFRSRKLQSARDRKKKQADEGNPLACSRYQRDYRASHPDYIIENRQKQQARNTRKADKTSYEPKIVNPDAFMSKRIDMESVTKAQPMFVRLL